MTLDNIHIVLVETSHPGNIGASARAMKTMGLHSLRLVAPKHFPHADATALASGADDLLVAAREFATLREAVADCVTVAATSARKRTLHWPSLAPRAAAQRLLVDAADGPVALVFGRERSGLSNEELDNCQWLVHIPTAADYASLNLAMAVQVLAYELRVAAAERANAADTEREMPPAAELERLYEHLGAVMLETGFLDPDNPRYLMRRMRLLLNRARPDQNEVNILRGLLAAVQDPRPRK